MNNYQEEYYYSDGICYDEMTRLEQKEADLLLRQATCSHRDYALHEDGVIYCKTCGVSEADVDNSVIERKVKLLRKEDNAL